MKKHLFALAMGLLLAGGATAFAQQAEACAKKDCKSTCSPKICSRTCANPDTCICPEQVPMDEAAPAQPACRPTPDGRGPGKGGCAPQTPGKDGKCCKADKAGKHGKTGKDGKHGKAGKDGRKFGKKDDFRKAAFEGIELTPQQQVQFDKLSQKQHEKSAKVKADAKKAKEKAKADKKKKSLKNREAYEKEVKKILTPEQYAKYQDNVKALKAQRSSEKQVKKEGRKRLKGDRPRNADGSKLEVIKGPEQPLLY